MSRRALTAALGALAVVLLSGCTGKLGSQLDTARNPSLQTFAEGRIGVLPIAERVAAPRVAGTTLGGTPLDVAALRGSVVVLNFWASWCGPCRGEAIALDRVWQARHAQGVSFVGVDVKDEASAAQAFQRRQRVPYPSIVDEAGLTLLGFHDLAPQTPPSTIVLDRRGRIAARFLGPVTEAQLDGPVQLFLKEVG